MLEPAFPLDFGKVQSSNTAPLCQIGTHTPTIDWLTLVQEHASAPMKGKSLLLFIDIETGELESQAVKSLQCEGSFSSKLMVRSDGRRVEVSGNPSRWGVSHSLDGFSTVQDCVDLYNSLLRSFDLPEFFAVERAFVAPRQLQRADGCLASEGMRITRLDLARLYQTGGPDEVAVAVRALGQVTHAGKSPMVYGRGETVAWGGGSRHVYVKYYAKGIEMKKHLKHGDDPGVADWASKVGLLRHEVTVKGMWLSKNGLERPDAWTREVMGRVADKYAMHARVGVARSSWASIMEDLLALDVPAGRARRAQEAAYAYLGGHVFRKGENIPVRTFYRLRADLRLVGLDISSALNVSALRGSVRVVDLTPAVLPVLYRRAC
jgi:Phage replication protein CRI